MSLPRTRPGEGLSVRHSLGRPREIRAGDRRLPVTSMEVVRDETAAYPTDAGPRTVFVVRSHDQRFRLVHLHRHRLWTVEALGPSAEGSMAAA